MAYTAVPTVNTNDSWSASDHNTYIKDNFAYIKSALDATVTSPPRCRVYVDTDFNSTTTLANVLWEGETFDTDSMFDLATSASRVNLTTAGLYLITANIAWSSGTAGSYRHAGIYIDGTTSPVAHLTVPAASSGITTMSLAGLYLFTAGQYVQLKSQSGETENVLYAEMTALKLV